MINCGKYFQCRQFFPFLIVPSSADDWKKNRENNRAMFQCLMFPQFLVTAFVNLKWLSAKLHFLKRFDLKLNWTLLLNLHLSNIDCRYRKKKLLTSTSNLLLKQIRYKSLGCNWCLSGCKKQSFSSCRYFIVQVIHVIIGSFSLLSDTAIFALLNTKNTFRTCVRKKKIRDKINRTELSFGAFS